ncbi:MAG TPA: hypothetical protein VK469_15195, partial [Candidatus Kapabacteria bacterium]|nr:hypothetical protein [Candidatus Kapabacteria bacterium]
MNLRKSIYFKPLCLLVAALFTAQCMSIKRELISTEEKVIENESQEFIYELEKIKAPSAQDPTIEYKIVKFPANRIQPINVYKKFKKANLWECILAGLAAGAAIGAAVGYLSGGSQVEGRVMNGFYGFFIGALTGGISVPKIGKKIEEEYDPGQLKLPAGSYLKKKPESTPIPVQDFPLEFKWGSPGKSNSFKTQTNEQGIV